MLSELEAALNVNGNQQIAQLQCSIFDPGNFKEEQGQQNDTSQQDDRIQNRNVKHVLQAEDDVEVGSEDLRDLDFDLFPEDDYFSNYHGGKSGKHAHTFGRVDSFRGRDQGSSQQGDA